MSKLEKMIADLEQLRNELKPEIKKAQEIDSDISEDIEATDELLYQAAATLRVVRKKIIQSKNLAKRLQDAFPDEK